VGEGGGGVCFSHVAVAPATLYSHAGPVRLRVLAVGRNPSYRRTQVFCRGPSSNRESEHGACGNGRGSKAHSRSIPGSTYYAGASTHVSHAAAIGKKNQEDDSSSTDAPRDRRRQCLLASRRGCRERKRKEGTLGVAERGGVWGLRLHLLLDLGSERKEVCPRGWENADRPLKRS
jgi:hypothetical protein